MSSFSSLLLLFSMFSISMALYCDGGGCTCTSGPCDIYCDDCKTSMTCYPDYPCTIDCTESKGCRESTIYGNGATTIEIQCNSGMCGATVYCTTSICTCTTGYCNGLNLITYEPTYNPTNPPTTPTNSPTNSPTTPTNSPTYSPTTPTNYPTNIPTNIPTNNPTFVPSSIPTFPTYLPTNVPSKEPTVFPTQNPSKEPIIMPTIGPTLNPTLYPTLLPIIPPPSNAPSYHPSTHPSEFTIYSTQNPSLFPTVLPSVFPTVLPSVFPTVLPSIFSSPNPTQIPSSHPPTTTYPSPNTTTINEIDHQINNNLFVLVTEMNITIVIGVSVCICMCILLLLCIIIVHRKRKRKPSNLPIIDDIPAIACELNKIQSMSASSIRSAKSNLKNISPPAMPSLSSDSNMKFKNRKEKHSVQTFPLNNVFSVENISAMNDAFVDEENEDMYADVNSDIQSNCTSLHHKQTIGELMISDDERNVGSISIVSSIKMEEETVGDLQIENALPIKIQTFVNDFRVKNDRSDMIAVVDNEIQHKTQDTFITIGESESDSSSTDTPDVRTADTPS